MPTNTYTALATVTLGGSDSEIVFSSIPATYRDLILIAAGATSSSNTQIQMRFNSDSGSNYPYVQMYGEGGGAGSDTNTLTAVRAIMGGTSGAGVAVFQIMDYSATDKHKTVLNRENNLGISWTGARASRWANTAAITSISLIPVSGSFASGTYSLYGVIA